MRGRLIGELHARIGGKNWRGRFFGCDRLVGFDGLRLSIGALAPGSTGCIIPAMSIGCVASAGCSASPGCASQRLHRVSGLAHVGRLAIASIVGRLRRIGRLQVGIVGHEVLHAAAARHRGGLRADIDVGPQAEHVVGVAGGDGQDSRDERAAQDSARAKMRRARQRQPPRCGSANSETWTRPKTQNRFKDSRQR